MIKKYTWDFNPEAETWYNDTFDTIEECIEDAKITIENDDHDYAETPNEAYIAETLVYTPRVDTGIVERIFSEMMDDAYETCGEIGSEWKPCDYSNLDELEDLRIAIDLAVAIWLKKHNRQPHFYGIGNIKEYSLK